MQLNTEEGKKVNFLGGLINTLRLSRMNAKAVRFQDEPAPQPNANVWVKRERERIRVRGSPRLLEAADALLQTADLGLLLVQDQDKPRVELRFQGFFASGITLQSAVGQNTHAHMHRKHASKNWMRRYVKKKKRSFVL